MNKIIILALFLLITNACKNDPLDITPDGRITRAEVFSDNDRTAAYLNSAYSYMQPYGIRHWFWSFLSSYSDDAHDNDSPTEGVSTTNWYNGAMTVSYNPISGGADDENGNYYKKAWKGIRTTNIFLANIETANVLSANDRKRWQAEAKVLRAFYYLDLIRMYGPMPVVDWEIELDRDFKTLSRATFDECVQFILRDCQEAIAEPFMPWRITNGPDRGRFTKAVAYAIMSQATLFNASPLWNPENDLAKWQQASDVSGLAIEALESNGYELFADYKSYFLTRPDIANNPADKETILESLNGGMGQVHGLNGIPSIDGVFKAGASPSQELVDAYEMENGLQPILGYKDADHLDPIINSASGYDEQAPYLNRDPRFYATVYHNGAYYGNVNSQDIFIESYQGGKHEVRNNDRKHTHNSYYLAKFLNGTLQAHQSSDATYRIFRLAEIYLNYAEAENEANGPQAAYAAVNKVRARPSVDIPALANLSKEEFRQRVRNERRVEFAFEGQRFWDVRRWKILHETDQFTTGINWVKTGNDSFDGTRFVVQRRFSWEDKFLTFPLHPREVVSTSLSQSPGW